ncbi:MAG: helix-turn-helix domain-containing protein [Actinomycetes bacterium]
MIRNVAVPVLDGVYVFELGVLCEVFGLDRPDEPLLPTFDFALCGVDPGAPVRTASGFTVTADHSFGRLAEADLIAVPAIRRDSPVPVELVRQLQAAVARGAWVLSVCSGAFVLGEAGLLDGRRCTTHWSYADELARRFPRAEVDPDVLYVDDDRVLTSAGTAAGIDACLYLMRKEFGERVVTRLARRMVVPPHREGGQQQYVETPVPPVQADTLTESLDWMREHLAEDITVDVLAAHAHMSARTFARRFRAETGTTPHHWLTGQRVLLAQRLLEEGERSVDEIADLAGFGSAALLRHHFVKRVGTTPQAYRRTFCARPA